MALGIAKNQLSGELISAELMFAYRMLHKIPYGYSVGGLIFCRRCDNVQSQVSTCRGCDTGSAYRTVLPYHVGYGRGVITTERDVNGV